MVRLGACFDAPEEAHRGVGGDALGKLHLVQVFGGYPTEDGSIKSDFMTNYKKFE